MTSHPDQIDTEIKNTLTTLFHSYDARGNDLAIAQAHAAVKLLVLKGQLDILNYCYTHKWMGQEPTGTSDMMSSIALNVQDRIKNLEGEIEGMQG